MVALGTQPNDCKRLADMSDARESAGLCPKCGANLDIVGLAHRCRPRVAAHVTEARDTAPNVTGKRDSVDQACPRCGGTGRVSLPKSAAERQRRSRARRGAGKTTA